jgi:hypothetical protein
MMHRLPERHPRRTPVLGLAWFAFALALPLAGCGESATEEIPCTTRDRSCSDPRNDRPGYDGTRDVTEFGEDCDPRSCAELDSAGLPHTDTDGDGVPDCVEGLSDVDDDGIAACLDDDSDGDGIPDEVEGSGDADGDGIPDALDADSDDDGIPDIVEGDGDEDEDGIPNYLDLDSDGDGVPDAIEYGHERGSGLQPIDRDNDGLADFLDLDADGDGLADSDEVGCPEASDRIRVDTDRDGFNDLVEDVFGSDPCDAESTIEGLVDFYFELPYMEPEQSDTLEFSTDVQFGDIVFNMDTTGSMGGAISNLKSRLSDTIVPEMAARLDNVAFGVTRFDDFPYAGYGGSGDVPFGLLQRVTISRPDAQSGVDRLDLHNGGDGPESGVEALYQIATGEGRRECNANVPAFDPAAGYRLEVSDGEIGGVGFREGSLPIVIHITDAVSHARNEDGYNCGATREQAMDALQVVGAKVVGVATNDTARNEIAQIAAATGAFVPPCAWGETRPGTCGAGECCTGANGAGVAPGSDGMCPLVFSVSSDGSGLDRSIVDGVDALLHYAPMDVTARARRDPAEALIDTSCFLRSIVPDVAIPPAGACAATPERVDFDGDGTLDGFAGVTPGTDLRYTITAMNDCVPPQPEPQVFMAFIDVIGDGTTVLDTQLVTILVPPDLKR